MPFHRALRPVGQRPIRVRLAQGAPQTGHQSPFRPGGIHQTNGHRRVDRNAPRVGHDKGGPCLDGLPQANGQDRMFVEKIGTEQESRGNGFQILEAQAHSGISTDSIESIRPRDIEWPRPCIDMTCSQHAPEELLKQIGGLIGGSSTSNPRDRLGTVCLLDLMEPVHHTVQTFLPRLPRPVPFSAEGRGPRTVRTAYELHSPASGVTDPRLVDGFIESGRHAFDVVFPGPHPALALDRA